MNFFEAQERARKSSRWLVWLFAASVLGVIAVLYVLVVFSQRTFGPDLGLSGDLSASPAEVPGWIDGPTFLWTAAIVGGMILIGSGYKFSQLSGGGKVVARDLGGRRVEPNTTDFAERRLLNVVEEMAIASGVPVPEVWVMDEEQGINAFAAGSDPSNAVVGVTRGTLERLDRHELQGVIAHEFSHILNGDMRLNMKLIGFVFGLVMLSVLGRMLLHTLRFSGGGSRRGGGGVILGMAAAGLAVWLVGSLGVLFARMIQAAISRQREFLADASAVQFTRDPSGIAGALKKIGGFSKHGQVKSAAASEARHLFFAGSASHFSLSTHPPLEKRIRAIEPDWQGEMLEGRAERPSRAELTGAGGFAGAAAASPPAAPRETKHRFPVDAAGLPALGESESIRPDLVRSLENETGDARIHLHSKHEAKAVMLGLIIGSDPSGLAAGKRLLESHDIDEITAAVALDVARDSINRSAEDKLGRIDLALPWLRKMHRAEAREFLGHTHALIHADDRIDLQEFVLQQVIARHVRIGLDLAPTPPMKYRRLDQLTAETGTILGAFATVGGGPSALESARAEFREHTGAGLTVPEGESIDFDALAAALKKADAATPLVKRIILRLCALVVIHDGKIGEREHQLLRAIAEAIGSTIPPLPRSA
jgi:Zn-dependent protease with chaperone function